MTSMADSMRSGNLLLCMCVTRYGGPASYCIYIYTYVYVCDSLAYFYTQVVYIYTCKC